MNTLDDVLLAIAVLAFVLHRQMRARPLDERSLATIPIVMIIIGAAQGGLADAAHPAVSVALLAAEAVAAVALGVWRAATVHLWRGPGGALWRRGTAWTAAAWTASIAIRAALIGAGYAAGVHPAAGAVLVFLGLTLLVQNLAVGLRARRMPATVPVPAAVPAAAPATVPTAAPAAVPADAPAAVPATVPAGSRS
ncbi:hypothetical protein [Actinomadura fibrosa]|uniref:DUF1453 domain-containing protein n=1 Tax=Actinomadura fibrosa TaxID=111802 RepID=A0ABW2XHX5_9ACTN|nr:hypothetical protein [Actinomadura fibrosa]